VADTDEPVWYVDTETYGKPYGWTDAGDHFAVYYSKKAGGYLPRTRRRWILQGARTWAIGIGFWGGLLLWVLVVGSLNARGHPGWAMLLLAAPVFYALGRYHQSTK
jgi:hypothetical protein